MIRKLDTNDLAKYRALRLASLETDPQAFHLRYAEAINQSDSFFLDEMRDIRFGCFGMFSQGTLLGMLTLKSSGEKLAQLFTLYVSPKSRGQGFGSALILHCLAAARSKNIEKCQLTVMRDNPALELYKKLGFREIEVVLSSPEEITLETVLMLE